MQKILRLIAKLSVARHECMYGTVKKTHQFICRAYHLAPETPMNAMMSSVIADCPDLVPPNILDKSTPVNHTKEFSPTKPHLEEYSVRGLTIHSCVERHDSI